MQVLLTIIVEENFQTEKAHALKIDGFAGTVWLPKSQTEDFHEDGESVSFVCPLWLAREKGLTEFIVENI